MASNVQVQLRLLGRQAFSAAAKGAGRDLDGLGAAARRSSGGLTTGAAASNRMERAVSRLRVSAAGSATALRGAGIAAGAVAATGGAALAAAGVDYLKTQDRQMVAFTTFLGSERRARRMVSDIQKLATDSPVLDPATTGNAVSSLLAFNVGAKESMQLVKALGDASAASGQSIQEVMPRAALAIGQIQAKGALSAEEMNQLAESVRVGRSQVAKELGLTDKQFQATFAPGKQVSADKALPAIQRALVNQSKGAADRLAKTTEGRMSKARETLSKGAGSLLRPVYDLAGRGAEAFAALITPRTVTRIQKTIGRVVVGVRKVGTQLIDAFKPAMPFVQNVLLPLLTGIGKGIVLGIVAAFKIAVPLIKVVATVLGAVGKVLAPLKPVFHGIGLVIGTVFGPAILRILGTIPKLGIVFRVLNAPMRLVIGAFRGVVAGIRTAWSWFGRLLVGAQRFLGTFTSMPARVGRAALNLVGRFMNAVESLPGKMVGGAKKAVSALVSGIKKGGTALLNAGKALGSKIVSGIVELIKSSPGKIKDAVMSVVPGPVKDAVGKLGGFVGLASGGEVSRTGWAVVGERGPELLRLPGGSTVYDHQQTKQARSVSSSPMRGAQMQFVIPITTNLDGRVIHQTTLRHERIAAEAA